MTTALKLESKENTWSFWLGWTVANSIGWAVGLTVMTAVQLALEAASGGALVEAEGGAVLESVGGLLFGLAVGAMQWWALRRRLAGSVWWVPATAGVAQSFGFSLPPFCYKITVQRLKLADMKAAQPHESLLVCQQRLVHFPGQLIASLHNLRTQLMLDAMTRPHNGQSRPSFV